MRFASIHPFGAKLRPNRDPKTTKIGPKTMPEITPKSDSENDAKMVPKRLPKRTIYWTVLEALFRHGFGPRSPSVWGPPFDAKTVSNWALGGPERKNHAFYEHLGPRELPKTSKNGGKRRILQAFLLFKFRIRSPTLFISAKTSKTDSEFVRAGAGTSAGTGGNAGAGASSKTAQHHSNKNSEKALNAKACPGAGASAGAGAGNNQTESEVVRRPCVSAPRRPHLIPNSFSSPTNAKPFDLGDECGVNR